MEQCLEVFMPSFPHRLLMQAIVDELQDTQQNKHARCDEFTYTVYSSQESVYFHLTATDFSKT